MFCGKCGKQVPNGCEFCMHCGEKVNAAQESLLDIEGGNKSKKNVKKLMFIGIISVVSLAVICCGILFAPKIFAPQIPFSAMNVNNYAQLAYDDDNVVYIGKYDSSDKKAVLVKANANGTNKKVLLDDENVSTVFLYKNTVYYKKQADSVISIHKIDIDGNSNTKIFDIPSKENTVTNLIVCNDKVYYILNKKINSIDLDGSNKKEVIAEDVTSFCIDNDTIYFTTEDYIKKQKISSDSCEEISKIAATSLCVYDGFIYFNKPSGSMYRLNLKNNSVELLGGKSVRNYIFDGDKIYFVEELTESEIETYASLVADSKKESDVLWAKIALIGTGKLFSMSLDGKEISKVETDSLLVSCLYNTPQNKYTKVSVFSSGVDELIFKK